MNLVIFDIDGTLTDSTEVDDWCMESTFKHFLGNNVRCDWSAASHVTDPVIVRETVEQLTGHPCPNDLYAEMKAFFLRLLEDQAQTYPDKFQRVPNSVEFIEALKSRGVHIGLGTGSWKASAEIKLRTAGVPYSSFFFGHADLAHSRAGIAAHVLAQAAAKIGAVPDNICYFGDGAWDLTTMNQLGWPFIGVDVKQNGKLLELGAKKVITNYSEIQATDLFC